MITWSEPQISPGCKQYDFWEGFSREECGCTYHNQKWQIPADESDPEYIAVRNYWESNTFEVPEDILETKTEPWVSDMSSPRSSPVSPPNSLSQRRYLGYCRGVSPEISEASDHDAMSVCSVDDSLHEPSADCTIWIPSDEARRCKYVCKCGKAAQHFSTKQGLQCEKCLKFGGHASVVAMNSTENTQISSQNEHGPKLESVFSKEDAEDLSSEVSNTCTPLRESDPLFFQKNAEQWERIRNKVSYRRCLRENRRLNLRHKREKKRSERGVLPDFTPCCFSDTDLPSEPDSLDHVDKILNMEKLGDKLEMYRRKSAIWIPFHQAALEDKWCACQNVGQFLQKDTWVCHSCWSKQDFVETCEESSSGNSQVQKSEMHLQSLTSPAEREKGNLSENDIEHSEKALDKLHEVPYADARAFGYKCACGLPGLFFRLDTQWLCDKCKTVQMTHDEVRNQHRNNVSQMSIRTNDTIEYQVTGQDKGKKPPSQDKEVERNNVPGGSELTQDELLALREEDDMEQIYLGVQTRENELEIQNQLIQDQMYQETENHNQLRKLCRKFRSSSSPGSSSTDPQLRSEPDQIMGENEMEAGELEAMDLEALEDWKAREEIEKARIEQQDEEEFDKVYKPGRVLGSHYFF